MPRVLTDRQADVLRLLCAGMTRAEAAAALGVRPDAVRKYLTDARVRLGTGTPAELCARCPDDLAAAEERAAGPAPAPGDHFVGLRVEHRRPDGTVRLLAATTMRSEAFRSAREWARRLKAAGEEGAVAVVRAATGEIVSERAIADVTP